jgi:hypothetical protein
MSYEPRRKFQKKVSYVDYSDSKNEDNMIGLAEWVNDKKTEDRSVRGPVDGRSLL